MGGGIYTIGGGVHAPVVLSSVDPEFSEEARKQKFSGNVLVGLVVDEQGLPSHVRILRGVGMGLDEEGGGGGEAVPVQAGDKGRAPREG